MVRFVLPQPARALLRGTTPRRAAVRNGLLLALSITLGSSLLLACSLPGRDSGTPDSGVVVQTFTPVPPDWTPPAALTRDAQGTQWAMTATVEAGYTPTPPGTPPTQGTLSVGVDETAREGEIRPPTAVLRTPGGDQIGTIGSFNYVDPVYEAGAKVDAPYVPLGDATTIWPRDLPGTIEVPDSPYAVRAATIGIYTYETNVARPTSPQGVPTGEIAFYPITPPAQTLETSGATIEIPLDVPPGTYIVATRIAWAGPANAQGEQTTQYVFVIKVE